jgi:hypothetical protein
MAGDKFNDNSDNCIDEYGNNSDGESYAGC